MLKDGYIFIGGFNNFLFNSLISVYSLFFILIFYFYLFFILNLYIMFNFEPIYLFCFVLRFVCKEAPLPPF